MATEDRLITRIFSFTLQPDVVESSGNVNAIFLADLSQELIDEGVESLLLTKDLLDRALMTRLMLSASPSLQSPVPYLLEVYARASNELRGAANKDEALDERLKAIAAYAQELAVSHAYLALTMDMFPQTQEAQERGANQLLDALDTMDSSALPGMPSTSAMPPGFLERFAAQHEEDGLAEIVSTIVTTLNQQLLSVSLLGEYQRPLQHLITLATIPPIAQQMTKLPTWTPRVASGRGVQTETLLGPAFSVTTIPDVDIFFGHPPVMPAAQPEATATVFRNHESRVNEIHQGVMSVRASSEALHTMQWKLTMLFLRPQATRDAMLSWLALALGANREYDKEMPDARKAAPRGLMLNLATVLLRVCQPFMDPASGKAWGKLDARYIDSWARLDYSEETRLHASLEEVKARREKLAANPPASFQPHFICECFFLTAKALHLGYVKLFGFSQQMARVVSDVRDSIRQMRSMLDDRSSLAQMQLDLLSRQVQVMEGQVDRLSGAHLCVQSEAYGKAMIESVLAFYRLVAVWLLREASPSYARGMPPDSPLPEPAPEGFCFLPEHLVEDLVETTKASVQNQEMSFVLESSPLEETVMFLISFMPAAKHINNIYLRAQLGEVLGYLLPQEETEEEDRFPSRNRRRSRFNSSSSSVAIMLDTNVVIQSSLVPNLLKLFVEIERTGRHNQFYEKFQVRQDIGRTLMRLWSNPVHKEVWVKTASSNPDLYSRFNYFLETDATLHLDDALKLLREEAEFWNLTSAEQGQEQTMRNHVHRGRTLRFHLHYASMVLRIIKFTTVVIWKPWLQQQAVKRVAGTLNYFLKYLTGPERKQLKLKDPANEVKFDPKDLLTQIASIYVNLARRDDSGTFAQAIVADKRSFYDDMFAEATQVLRNFGLLPEDEIEELDRLSLETSNAIHMMEAEDAAEAGAPEEFFDPIMSELMSEPVTLPSGVNVERESILRHMMSDPTDPFSRAPLTEDSLRPNLELKARIQQWKAEHMGGSA